MTTEFDQRISLAIADGHNMRPALERFIRRAGFQFELRKNGNLHAEVQENLLLRSITVNDSKDIPSLLIAGVYNFAKLGRDRLREAQLGGMEIAEVLPLGLSRCRVALEVPNGSLYEHPRDLDGARIATSYENITRDFFRQHNTEVKIVEYHGKEEGAPAARAADAVVAIYVSGGTATENGLVLISTLDESTLLESEAVLAAPTAFLNEHGSDLIVRQFIDRIRQTADNPRRRLYQSIPAEGSIDPDPFLSSSGTSVVVPA